MTSSAPLLLPGQPLPAAYTTPPLPQCGAGCYEVGGKILASVVGRPHRDGAVVSVIGKEGAVVVPDIGCIVIGQVARLTPQQAHIVIQIVNNRPVADTTEDLTGVVRIADIRLTERDKVKMSECFRLGDIVKAKVVAGLTFLVPLITKNPRFPTLVVVENHSNTQLSLGDARSYYLSTAANELGVVYATSEDGNPLLPVSYQEMEDPQTGRTERRKVAKPEV